MIQSLPFTTSTNNRRIRDNFYSGGTVFSLTQTPLSPTNVKVFSQGLIKHYNFEYSIVGNIVTFFSPVPLNTATSIIYQCNQSHNRQVQNTIYHTTKSSINSFDLEITPTNNLEEIYRQGILLHPIQDYTIAGSVVNFVTSIPAETLLVVDLWKDIV